MDPVDVFSARDLRQRSGELLKDAENGQLALITKHGRPAILAVPFDDPIEQGRLGVQVAIEAANGRPMAGLTGPEIDLVTHSTLSEKDLPLSPAGFLPEIQ